jgi:hypothetical protein
MGTKLSINGITFGDASVQNTAATTGVTSLTAGSGISVSGATGAVTVSATGGGTVTSVATGNGLQGGTITSSGTLSLASPDFNTVGSYSLCQIAGTGSVFQVTSGSNYSVGTGNQQIRSMAIAGGSRQLSNNLSGSWKWMAATHSIGNVCGYAQQLDGICVRVS